MRWSLCFFLLCGAVAGVLVGNLVPAGVRGFEQHGQPFHLARGSDDPVEVTEARWFFLPFQFGDFDLQLDIELGEGADVDVLLRQVEPRIVGSELLPFTGRFAVLRLSTEGDGVGWRTREQALLGPSGDGVEVAPGRQSTVWIKARGRMLQANVAGKVQPWFEADDTYGMFAMVARGGNAYVHRLDIDPVRSDRRWLWSPFTWGLFGLLGAAVVAAAAVGFDVRRSWILGGIVLVLFARWFGRHGDLDLAFPDPGAMLMALAACLLATAVLLIEAVRGPWLLAVVVLAAWLGDTALSGLRHDTRAIDALFGPDAGAQVSEAHAQRVRGKGGVLDVGGPRPRVFLLGGQLLYDRGAPADHLELALGTRLRGALQRPVEVPCLPTVDGYAAQQWRLFTQCFTGYRPEVIVLGVSALEDAEDPATGLPRSSPATLAETVRAARDYCAQHDCQLVLFADANASPDLLAELQTFADELPLVIAGPDDAPGVLADKLAAVILPLLR